MGTREGAECTHGGKTRLGQGRDKVRCTTPSQRNHSTPAARSAHNSQLLLGRDCNGPYEQMLLGSSLTLAGFTILMSRSVPAQTTYTYYMTTCTDYYASHYLQSILHEDTDYCTSHYMPSQQPQTCYVQTTSSTCTRLRAPGESRTACSCLQ